MAEIIHPSIQIELADEEHIHDFLKIWWKAASEWKPRIPRRRESDKRSSRNVCSFMSAHLFVFGRYSQIAVDHRDSDGRGHWEVCDTTAGLTNDFTHLVY